MVASVSGTAVGRSSVPSGQTRETILAAAIAAIARYSLSGTTVERVAELAGVAPGTVILHFKRKEALLVAALDHVAQEFEQARRATIADAADDPVAALESLIDTSLDPEVSEPAKVAVWYAFWGEAGSRSVYLERVGAMDRIYKDDLVRVCAELIRRGDNASADAEAVAIGLIGLLDYLWQNIMVEGAEFDRRHARRMVRAYLSAVFPRHFPTEAQPERRQP